MNEHPSMEMASVSGDIVHAILHDDDDELAPVFLHTGMNYLETYGFTGKAVPELAKWLSDTVTSIVQESEIAASAPEYYALFMAALPHITWESTARYVLLCAEATKNPGKARFLHALRTQPEIAETLLDADWWKEVMGE